MDVRKKLVELLVEFVEVDAWDNGEFIEKDIDFGKIAENLIANGVTVQDEAKLYWKPVKPGEWNLTCSACDSHLGCREDAKFCPECGAKFVYPKAVMPQPPKEE